MSHYLQAFNLQFEEFVNDIGRVFPNDNEIATAANALKKLRKANPKLIATAFNDYVNKPYGNHIHDNNLKYFLEKDYTNDVGGATHGNEIIEKVNMLKVPISNMNSEEQKKVLKYLQNLCKLSELYNT
jgi:hypothetical protein